MLDVNSAIMFVTFLCNMEVGYVLFLRPRYFLL